MLIEKMQVSDLSPADYNPRKIGLKERKSLKNSIERFGLVQPIIWNRQTKRVVGGHQRLDILLQLGQVDTDVVVVDFNEVDEKALNIALNKISGEWDDVKLGDIIRELKASDYDLLNSGFDKDEINDIIKISGDGEKLYKEILDRKDAKEKEIKRYSFGVSRDNERVIDNALQKTGYSDINKALVVICEHYVNN